MHELSIATSLIEQVLEYAESGGLATVESVELEVGALMLIVPDALDLAFQAVCSGTLAEGAELKLMEVTARARCRDCGHEYAAAMHRYTCPECGQANAQIIAGQDIILKSMSGVPHHEMGGSV
jgi:hydrogenase nickel incorporation protein HypA/HybF